MDEKTSIATIRVSPLNATLKEFAVLSWREIDANPTRPRVRGVVIGDQSLAHVECWMTVALSWPELALSEMPMIVAGIAQLTDGKIEIRLVEDVALRIGRVEGIPIAKAPPDVVIANGSTLQAGDYVRWEHSCGEGNWVEGELLELGETAKIKIAVHGPGRTRNIRNPDVDWFGHGKPGQLRRVSRPDAMPTGTAGGFVAGGPSEVPNAACECKKLGWVCRCAGLRPAAAREEFDPRPCLNCGAIALVKDWARQLWDCAGCGSAYEDRYGNGDLVKHACEACGSNLRSVVAMQHVVHTPGGTPWEYRVVKTCGGLDCDAWAKRLAEDGRAMAAPTAKQVPAAHLQIDSITLDAEGGLRLEEIGYDGPGQYARQLGCTCRDFHNARSEDGVLEAQHDAGCVLRDWRIRARRGDLQVVGVGGVVMPADRYTRMVYGEETAERLRERNNALALNAAAKRAADPLPRPPRTDGFSQDKIDEIKATMLASGKRGGS